jgi:LPXTG-motif cell wall-anchored protein
MDLSSSMSGQVNDAIDAVDTFVDALQGTPSRVALFSFDATSPAKTTLPNVPTLRSVRTVAEAAVVKSDYHAWVSDSGTNWDAGLYTVAAAAPHYDVLLMITDGHPYGFGTVTYQGAGKSNLKGIEAGILSANLVKSEGTRIVTVGVSSSSASQIALNLKALSGPVEGSDYFASSSFDAAAADLAALAQGNCDGTITVNKRVIPAEETIPANATQTQLDAISATADGWEISASTTASGVSIASPGGPWVTDAAGRATVPLSFTQPTASGAVTVTETIQDDFAHQPVTSGGSSVNAVCTNSETGAAVSTVNQNSATAPGFTVTGSSGGAIDCTIYNREVATQELTLVKQVSFGSAATTSWTLSATAPAGSVALTGPTGTYSAATPLTAVVSVNVPYTLAESGGPATYKQVGTWACALTADPSTAVSVTGSQVTLAVGGDVTCTATNATAAVTLLTNVVDGDGSVVASDWTLTATPATMAGLAADNVAGAEYAVAGNPSSTFDVRPGHSYAITDALVDPATPLAYRLIRIELRNPDGRWSPIADNQITAPAAGQTAIYRFVNEAIPPVVLPLTGGTSSDVYFLAGGIILIAALGAADFVRRRRRMFA